MSEVWADIGRRGKRINYSTRKRLTQDNIFFIKSIKHKHGEGMGWDVSICDYSDKKNQSVFVELLVVVRSMFMFISVGGDGDLN